MSRFLVVDDHRLFLEGMRHLLQNIADGITVDLSATVADALQRIDQGINYDLMLLDLQLPEMDGFTLLKSLKARSVLIPTIIVSSSTDASVIRECLAAGASGFINKNASAEEMAKAIKQVLAGEVALPEAYLSQLELITRDGTKQTLVPPEQPMIGERQLEVLKLIDKGLSNNQIATVMSISKATVKYHISILFRSLEARNRTTCLARAREQGLLD